MTAITPSSTGGNTPPDAAHAPTLPPKDSGADGSGARRATPRPLVYGPSHPMGNARILIERCFTQEQALLLAHHRGAVREWDGRAWPEMEEAAVREAVWVFFENAEYISKEKLVPFRPNRSKVADIVEALKAIALVRDRVEMPSWRSEPGASPTEILPMANGLLHVPNRQLLPATPGFFNAYAVPYPYDPTASTPDLWLAFLDELWPADEQSKLTLQEVIGYLLMSDTSQQKIIFLVGPKRSGKSTIARVIRGLLGGHNVAGPTLASLGTNFGLQALIDKPVAIIADARLGGRTDRSVVTERLLTISGEDTITADRKYKGHWTGTLPTRLVIISNETPALSDTSGALASRFLVLKTDRSFYGDEDPTLTRQLLVELPGILQWALDGYDRLQARGHFTQPDSATDVIDEMNDLASPVAAFIRDRCEMDPAFDEPTHGMYNAWVAWCEEHGRRPSNAQTFGRDLRAVHPEVQTSQRRTGHDDERERVYRGIRVRAR